MDLERFTGYLKDAEELNLFDEFLKSKWLLVKRAPYHYNALEKTRLPKRRFNPLLDMTEQQFRYKYCFTKDNMRKVIEMVRDDLEADYSYETRTNQVPVEMQIMAAVRVWALTEHPEVTAIAHAVSYRTLAKICKRVACAFSSKASRYIRMPATLAEKERVTNAFQALAGMPHVIGAVSHSYVRFGRGDFEKDNDPSEGYVQIQIVADATYKIRDIVCMLHPYDELKPSFDMFAQTKIKERFEQNEFRGRVLLGDDRMACTSLLFTRVHGASTAEEQGFNRSHALTHAPVTKSLNLWRQRFGILGSEISANYNIARHTIIALALLHNMAMEWNDPSLDCNLNGFSNREFPINTFAAFPPAKNGEINARLDFIKNYF